MVGIKMTPNLNPARTLLAYDLSELTGGVVTFGGKNDLHVFIAIDVENHLIWWEFDLESHHIKRDVFEYIHPASIIPITIAHATFSIFTDIEKGEWLLLLHEQRERFKK